MNRFTSAILSLALSSLAATWASAAPVMPAEFRGIWLSVPDETLQCRAKDWDDHSNEALFKVTSKGFEAWESGCDLTSLRRHDETQVEAEFSCSGEGLSWRSREILTLRNFGSHQLLVSIQVRQWDDRDDSGRPIKPSVKFSPRVLVALRCQ